MNKGQLPTSWDENTSYKIGGGLLNELCRAANRSRIDIGEGLGGSQSDSGTTLFNEAPNKPAPGTIFAKITGKGQSDGQYKAEEVFADGRSKSGGREWDSTNNDALGDLIEVNSAPLLEKQVDTNEDGLADRERIVIVWKESDGNWYFEHQGDASFSNIIFGDETWTQAIDSDVDGDGVDERVIQHIGPGPETATISGDGIDVGVDANNHVTSVAGTAGGSQVKVSSNETDSDYLVNQITTPDTWLDAVEINDGADESLKLTHTGPGTEDSTISADGLTIGLDAKNHVVDFRGAAGGDKVKVTSADSAADYLDQQIATPGAWLFKTVNGGGGTDQTLHIEHSGADANTAANIASGWVTSFTAGDGADATEVVLDATKSNILADANGHYQSTASAGVDKVTLKEGATIKLTRSANQITIAVDWTAIPGYDGSAQQFLGHDGSGNLQWYGVC